MKQVCFSASRLSELLSGGTGKTKNNYIFDLALKAIGADKDIATPAMKHGIQNEPFALQLAQQIIGGKPNVDENGNQIFYPINRYVGATPDLIGDGFVLDSKCNYYIHTFFEQKEKLSAKYHIQVQCQMMALKVDKGYLFNFLTKPEIWGEDEWTEYPFPIEDRYSIHEINPESEIQDKILSESEKWYQWIYYCVDKLSNATLLDDVEFFYKQFTSKVRFLKLKDVNWMTDNRQVFRYMNDFYVIK